MTRAFWLLAWAVAITAQAQSPGTPGAPGSDSPTRERAQRQLEMEQRATFDELLRQSRDGARPSEAEAAVQAVAAALAKGDCAEAVKQLNAGLNKGGEVLMLAGAMYDEGFCLKPNWERALSFYDRALAAGTPGVAARVAAGYASAAGGRDRGTALWWAIRAGTALPEPCARVAPLAADADRFVAALNAWPAGQLDACAWAAAVMASVQSEVEASRIGRVPGITGCYRVRLRASQGQFELVDETAGAQPDFARSLNAHLRRVADRALARHERPARVPEAWQSEAVFEFKPAR